MRGLLLHLLGMIVAETLPVDYSSISVDYLKPYGDRNCFFFLFFSSMRGCEDSSMYILLFPAPCNRNVLTSERTDKSASGGVLEGD